MRLERSKNAIRNLITGSIMKTYQMIVPFVIRTVIIHQLGMEYLGLGSLFSSLLQVLNLAELGVGSAMVFSMYKPIAEDDYRTINDLMRIYQYYYRIIGFVILCIGIFISPFVPRLIKGEIPQDLNVYLLYYMNLSVTVASYWLFAYKNCLLLAHQRNDIISRVTIATNTVTYVVQMILLVTMHNYYAYLVASLLGQIALNICISISSDRLYPLLKPSRRVNRELSKTINQKIKDLFTSKVGEIIVNSADSIVISAFLGLSMLASYTSYYYILSAIFGFLMLFLQGCTAGIGNSLIVETQEKNYNDLLKMTLIVSWIAGFCACCLLCLYQPFMELWIGKQNLLPENCVVCLVIYFYSNCIKQLFIVVKDAAGMWHKDRFRPMATALTNLTLNLIMVQLIGIYGVLLSTVISNVIVGIPWLLKNLFSTIYSSDLNEYARKLFMHLLITGVSVVITYYMCNATPFVGIPAIIVRLIICCISSNILYYLAYRKTKEYKDAVTMVDRIVGNNVPLLHKVFMALIR